MHSVFAGFEHKRIKVAAVAVQEPGTLILEGAQPCFWSSFEMPKRRFSVTKRQNSIHGGFTNAELGENPYLSGPLGRKPQNMLTSLWSDWFSTLVFAGRLRFGDAFPLAFEHHFAFKLSDPA